MAFIPIKRGVFYGLNKTHKPYKKDMDINQCGDPYEDEHLSTFLVH